MHHGRWVLGVCWDSPWYRTLPDQAVLRLRRIGLTATLTMRVTQWLPLVGWCHVTTGLATVRGLGTIYLDDVDLEHLAEPVQVRIARERHSDGRSHARTLSSVARTGSQSRTQERHWPKHTHT